MRKLPRTAACLCACLALLSRFSNACYVPPAEQRVPYDRLIARTARIALAEVIAEPTAEKPYRFRTVEVLRGKVQAEFEVAGSDPGYAWDKTYDDHKNPDFWQGGGSSANAPDCRIHPSFKLGKRYLVFLDEPYHTKSFELIESKSDKWLVTVRRLAKKPKSENTVASPIISGTAPDAPK